MKTLESRIDPRELNLKHLLANLQQPMEILAEDLLMSDVSDINEHARPLIAGFLRLVKGDLKNMYDGPTTPNIRFDGPVLVQNFRNLEGDAKTLMVICTTALSQSAWSVADSKIEIATNWHDESWALFNNLAFAEMVNTGWRLARQFGVQNGAVMHHLSDMDSPGAESHRLVNSILGKSDVKVVYRQDKSEVDRTSSRLGLNPAQAELLPTLKRGEALWLIGERHWFVVKHRLSPMGRKIVYTDDRMRTSRIKPVEITD